MNSKMKSVIQGPESWTMTDVSLGAQQFLWKLHVKYRKLFDYSLMIDPLSNSPDGIKRLNPHTNSSKIKLVFQENHNTIVPSWSRCKPYIWPNSKKQSRQELSPISKGKQESNSRKDFIDCFPSSWRINFTNQLFFSLGGKKEISFLMDIAPKYHLMELYFLFLLIDKAWYVDISSFLHAK